MLVMICSPLTQDQSIILALRHDGRKGNTHLVCLVSSTVSTQGRVLYFSCCNREADK
jgi:hypothetical protein